MMSGIDDLMAERNDRWATAVERAQGIEDKGLGRAVRTYYSRYFPIGLIVLVIVGALVGKVLFGMGSNEWFDSLRFGCAFAALGVFVCGLIHNVKRVVPAADVGGVDVLMSLKSEEQKDVRRQILGKVRLQQEHLSVIRGSAVQLRKNLATQLVFAPALPLVFLPQAFGGEPVLRWLMTGLVVAQIIANAFLVREFRRVGIFLERTRL